MILFYYKSVLYILTLIIIILLAVLFTYSKNRIRNKELFLNPTQEATLSAILVNNNPELKAKTNKQVLDAKILEEILKIVGKQNIDCFEYTSTADPKKMCEADNNCVYTDDNNCFSKESKHDKMNKLIKRVYDKYNLLHKQSESLEFQQKTLLRQTELNSECAQKIVNSTTGPSYNDETKKQKCEDKGICIYNTDQK